MIVGKDYCSKCGAKRIEQKMDTFDKDTGERDVRLVCPTGKCGHDGIWHGYTTMFRRTCKRCGEPLPLINYD